jgi:4-diphosphocytidyl-2-C-methyl-D-erythritol kinase
MERIIQLKSYAKINLGLEVVSKRADGYHNLKTVFQTIDLYDTITLKKNASGLLHLDGDDPAVGWDEKNTIFRAVDHIDRHYRVGRGFDIEVRKRIPAGSGLGGGSSNAAVILLFLNEYYKLDLPLQELIRLGAEIGADVPFFLVGGTVLGEGIGDRLTPLPDLEERRLDLVIPPDTVSTGLIFSRFGLTSKPIKSKIDTFVSSNNVKILENNLEKITFELFPGVAMIKEKMQEYGYDLVLMSGSGSAVYGLVSGRQQRTFLALKKDFPGYRVLESGSINRKSYLEGIGAWPSGKASVFGADMRRFESSRPS